MRDGLRRIHLIALVAVGLLATACEQGPRDANERTAGSEPPAARQLPAPSEDVLRADLRFLADDLLEGRDTGSRGYEIAARYVETRFQALGLEPAGENGYLQMVPYLERRLVEDSARFTLHDEGEDIPLAYEDDFLMSGDTVRATTRVRAPLVFVGHGVTAPGLGVDDYADVDVEGKIVVLYSGAPADFPHDQRAYYSSGLTKAETAVANGAVGMISMRNRQDRERRPWERSVKYAGTPGMAWLSEDGEAARHFSQIEGGASLSPEAADALIARAGRDPEALLDAVAEGNYETFPLGFEATLARRTEHAELESPNVIGLLPGSDPELADEYVVFTGHLDHKGVGPADDSGDTIYNGAYDNAMGIAIMLETARLLASLETAPRRSILFVAFSGEEKGLLGAEYFAKHLPVDGEMVANVNLDMPVFLEEIGDVIAFGAEHSSLGEIAASAAEDAGWRLSEDPWPEEVIFVRSDHYMLVREGIPAIYLVPGVGEEGSGGAERFRAWLKDHYHQPSDDISQPVHWPSVMDFTTVNASIGRQVADADERPHWLPGDFFGQLFAPGTTREDP